MDPAADVNRMSRRPRPEALTELLDKLWAERHLLEFLLFKLTAAKLILAADERHLVAPALNEVERAVDLIRAAELSRSLAVARVAEEWGIPVYELSLTYLAHHGPEVTSQIFADHRQAFLDLTAEIEETAAVNRKMATSALDTIRDSLGTLAGDEAAETYDPHGRRTALRPAGRRLDRSL
jgi:hypothetical protein